MKNEIILYRPDGHVEHIEVRFDEDTVWLNRQQLAMLFGRDVKTIGKHINNVFTEGELDKKVTVANFATVTQHGAIKGKSRTINVEHYNLDVIISVGYRVKSQQGTQFRIWATSKLKDFLLKGYIINNRIGRIENDVEVIKSRINEIDLQIRTHNIPTQGIFFDGDIFDAYELVSKIIRSAKHSIILIDNYINEDTITHLTKKNKNVQVLLLTNTISKQLTLDVQKANSQYNGFEIKHFSKSHDRFLIIDNGKEVYHIGASLKDLGKKWVAFSKLGKEMVEGIINTVSSIH
ncbi:MAG: virulence RhuM family protein [Oscillospiraceae bacterium]|jgi:hypothetical protein|nr:virulence RhuM family protein [Oscillospiraceae bacterium]